jgi:NADH dehydrogenase [ubiquinone] 1 alpha subcomplex assembly factor 5
MIGGFARQAAHVSMSVASSVSPQDWQPASPSQSILLQHSAQKLPTWLVMVAQPGHRGGSARSRIQLAADLNGNASDCMSVLSRRLPRRTSVDVNTPLFDHNLLAMRRDRAANLGVETFLYDRAFQDCLDRLADVRRKFSSLLLAGCPNPLWPQRFAFGRLEVTDPGSLMASRAGGRRADIEGLPYEAGQFDLCMCIGLLDTANNLPLAAAALHLVLEPGGLLIGAIPGGQSLPRLRTAMIAADRVAGQASPRTHPRIEAPALARLLTEAGFREPVIDIDRVDIDYRSLDALVRDLRAMGTTNVLNARSRRPLGREALRAARAAFLNGEERAIEQVEIVHFAAWKSA